MGETAYPRIHPGPIRVHMCLLPDVSLWAEPEEIPGRRHPGGSPGGGYAGWMELHAATA